MGEIHCVTPTQYGELHPLHCAHAVTYMLKCVQF